MSLTCPLDDYDVEGFLGVCAAFGQERFGYVVTPNADHLIRYHDDARFRVLYADAAYVLLDSRFLASILRFTQGLRIRVCTGSDLTARLFQMMQRDDDVVVVGANAQQARILTEKSSLARLHHYNPPMGFINSPDEVEACIRFVEDHSPFRFCFIAVGAPQQEILAQALKARGKARGLALCVGGSINFLTGVERRAPILLQRLSLEWLFRLLNDPRRLAKRYLVRGPRVFSLLRRTTVVVRPGSAAECVKP